MLFTEITAEEFAEIRARESFVKGEARGIKCGAAQKQREIAKEMLAEGIELSAIAKITKLSVDEIKSL